ncbi:hypothetical protein J3B02_004125 [Coemansia erecta]|nr:hypothetical protein J3B02_004125 [Coemansia erecta]
MSAVDTIRIQGSEDSFSSDKFTINTNVYIVNRLFAKSGKGDNPLRLHYKSRGVWIKCEHQSPLKRYAKMELEFRSFEKPVDSNDLDENVEYDLDGNEIENTEYLDKLNAMMEEAAMIRSFK